MPKLITPGQSKWNPWKIHPQDLHPWFFSHQKRHCGHVRPVSAARRCDACKMSVDFSLWFTSYTKLWSQALTGHAQTQVCVGCILGEPVTAIMAAGDLSMITSCTCPSIQRLFTANWTVWRSHAARLSFTNTMRSICFNVAFDICT